MPTKLNPYISFKDNAREAMQFYQTVFGGNLTMSTFADFQASEDPAESASSPLVGTTWTWVRGSGSSEGCSAVDSSSDRMRKA